MHMTSMSDEDKDFIRLEGRGADYGVAHFRALKSFSLAEFVTLAGEIPIRRAVELIELGAVYVDQNREQDAESAVHRDADIRIHLNPRRFSITTPLLPRVLRWTSDHLVIDKPSGIPTHALVDNACENLITFLERELQASRSGSAAAHGTKIFITHRLDVETSGALILALNKTAQARINAQIANKSIRRIYYAWVETPVTPGYHLHFMKPTPDAPKIVSAIEHQGWQRCALTVLSCEQNATVLDQCSLQLGPESRSANNAEATRETSLPALYRLVIELETGRSQQIRAQLAQLGAPIAGDKSYGSKLKFLDRCTRNSAIGLRSVDGMN